MLIRCVLCSNTLKIYIKFRSHCSRSYCDCYSGHAQLFPKCSLHFSWVSNLTLISLKCASFKRKFYLKGFYLILSVWDSSSKLLNKIIPTLACWKKISEVLPKINTAAVHDVLCAEGIVYFHLEKSEETSVCCLQLPDGRL